MNSSFIHARPGVFSSFVACAVISGGAARKVVGVAAKAANITLIEVRIGYAIGGKGYVTLTGDVGAVRAAVAAAEREAELLVGTTVIPRPSPKLFQSLL